MDATLKIFDELSTTPAVREDLKKKWANKLKGMDPAMIRDALVRMIPKGTGAEHAPRAALPEPPESKAEAVPESKGNTSVKLYTCCSADVLKELVDKSTFPGKVFEPMSVDSLSQHQHLNGSRAILEYLCYEHLWHNVAYGGQIVEVGGNPMRNSRMGRDFLGIHYCLPNLDATDHTRNSKAFCAKAGLKFCEHRVENCSCVGDDVTTLVLCHTYLSEDNFMAMMQKYPNAFAMVIMHKYDGPVGTMYGGEAKWHRKKGRLVMQTGETTAYDTPDNKWFFESRRLVRDTFYSIKHDACVTEFAMKVSLARVETSEKVMEVSGVKMSHGSNVESTITMVYPQNDTSSSWGKMQAVKRWLFNESTEPVALPTEIVNRIERARCLYSNPTAVQIQSTKATLLRDLGDYRVPQIPAMQAVAEFVDGRVPHIDFTRPQQHRHRWMIPVLVASFLSGAAARGSHRVRTAIGGLVASMLWLGYLKIDSRRKRIALRTFSEIAGVCNHKEISKDGLSIVEEVPCLPKVAAVNILFHYRFAVPAFPTECTGNEISAIEGRVLQDVTEEDGAWKAMGEFYRRYPLSYKSVKVENFSEWVKRYPVTVQTELLEAHKSLAVKPLCYDDTKVSGFLKQEATLFLENDCPDYTPRFIQARTPRYKAALGPYMTAFNDRLKGHWSVRWEGERAIFNPTGPNIVYTSGMTALQLGRAFLAAKDLYGFARTFECDMERYDGTQDKGAIDWELAIYRPSAKSHPQALTALNFQSKTFGFSRNGLRFKYMWKRKTGEFNTSCGNSLINGYSQWSGLEKAGIKNFVLFILGDDSLLVCSGWELPDWKDPYTDVGLTEMMELHLKDLGLRPKYFGSHGEGDPEYAEYCSGWFYTLEDGTMAWGPKPAKTILKMLYTHHVHLSPELRLRWVREVAENYLVSYPYVPILTKFCAAVMRCTHHVRGIEASKIPAVYKYTAVDVMGKSCNRDMVARRYGVSIERLDLLESAFDSLKLGDDMPDLFDDFIKEDCKGGGTSGRHFTFV